MSFPRPWVDRPVRAWAPRRSRLAYAWVVQSYEWAVAFFGWLKRHRVVMIVFLMMLYAGVILFGAFASSNGPAEPRTPWTGAIATAVSIPLVVLLALKRRTAPEDEREAARARSRRAAGIEE